MGTYGLGKEDIAEALLEALNNLEGDIYKDDLIDVLQSLKLYPYITDKIYPKTHLRVWKKWLKSLNLNE